jgi:hypothetical protein
LVEQGTGVLIGFRHWNKMNARSEIETLFSDIHLNGSYGSLFFVNKDQTFQFSNVNVPSGCETWGR